MNTSPLYKPCQQQRQQDAMSAARHICEEARIVLTSLRGGPPAVARGELAQDLMELRILVKSHLEKPESSLPTLTYNNSNNNNNNTATGPMPLFTSDGQLQHPGTPNSSMNLGNVQQLQFQEQQQSLPSQNEQGSNSKMTHVSDDEESDGVVLVQERDAQDNFVPESPMPSSRLCTFGSTPNIKEIHSPMYGDGMSLPPDNVGPYARPFLSVVMDPRAAGPHTLVALRALYRLLERGSLTQAPSMPIATSSDQKRHFFNASYEPLMRGVLLCKFEQTDAGADEAVEMAIADLLSLLVGLDMRSFQPETLMDAFNTVFVTRNTFVHSPALCYHFEDVLTSIVVAVFQDIDKSMNVAARMILEFLVNQLLHTPLVAGEILDEPSREAHMAHDDTRILCLRLARCCLRTGWGYEKDKDRQDQTIPESVLPVPPIPSLADDSRNQDQNNNNVGEEERNSLIRIIQDDLCLSLLMTGQAIWAYHDASSNISPGVISLEVLSEICATLSILWNTDSLRPHLVSQFETIFTGFYQRALSLLRKRLNPIDSSSFNDNLVFDAEVEVILESLVDILCLHDVSHDIKLGKGGALETLYAAYDCHMNRSDVASGLVIELCRCCGGNIGANGEELFDSATGLATTENTSRPPTPTATRSNSISSNGNVDVPTPGLLQWRQVPAHLKELCAEALIGGMRCLFHDRNLVSDGKVGQQQQIVSEQVNKEHDNSATIQLCGSFTEVDPKDCPDPGHSLRYNKENKRFMCRAAQLFNEKPTKGIQYLVKSGVVPDPITPANVANFLRNAIVVGLDKKAVGSYLGEAGKTPVAGKSPPSWERDWFHKEVLSTYCSLFQFEGQSLLDGLRMFLACFRLPGEAQQIDRILQAFAESCGRSCLEAAKVFSPDPKKAADAAYLLSFSIIMLNTDQHNDNIREDRKMKMEDFVKNNTDYGQDITDKGHELPQEFLEDIYKSIREEEIRTEGEGAAGHMTVERWKDVLRGPPGSDKDSNPMGLPSPSDAEDLKELILETLWMPLLSAIGALWGFITHIEEPSLEADTTSPRGFLENSHTGMLGAQGARLGMDMALELLEGVRNIGRTDIYNQIFKGVCCFSGLMGPYTTDAVDRIGSFANSVEAQSAVIVAIQSAHDAGDTLGHELWKCIWALVFELRDLKMLGGGVSNKRRSILMETDPDLLKENARREWTMTLIKGGLGDDYYNENGGSRKVQKKGFFGSFFGSGSIPAPPEVQPETHPAEDYRPKLIRTAHVKEESIVWDELAASDDEDDGHDTEGESDFDESPQGHYTSPGASFESQLIHEDFMLHNQEEMPVTGLERIEDTRQYQISPRARVRRRLAQACNFAGLVSDSRFLDVEGIKNLVKALISIIHSTPPRLQSPEVVETTEVGKTQETQQTPGNYETGNSFADFIAAPLDELPISPASEAFAEIIICEIVLKNKDRLGMLWEEVLREHYTKRLSGPFVEYKLLDSTKEKRPVFVNPGIEKCATGLIRICCCAVLREGVANDIIGSLNIFQASSGKDGNNPLPLSNLDKHVGEGLWRICSNVDSLRQLNLEGWDGLLSLIQWCARRGGYSVRQNASGKAPTLAEDDPALQAYRVLHLMLHSPDLKDVVPFRVVDAIRALIAAGERGNYPKLSVAALDLLHVLHTRLEILIGKVTAENSGEKDKADAGEVWMKCWVPVLMGIAGAAEFSSYPSVRQHALSTLTDAFIDKHGKSIPPEQLCKVLQTICVPLAGKRMEDMFSDETSMMNNFEEIMIEFELSISLIFKPFLHHLKNVLKANADILSVWKPILAVMERLLADDIDFDSSSKGSANHAMSPAMLLQTTKNLASEHLRNAIMVLIASGVLKGNPTSPDDISAVTWSCVGNMKFCKDTDEWQRSALEEEKQNKEQTVDKTDPNEGNGMVEEAETLQEPTAVTDEEVPPAIAVETETSGN